jgi:hypothetical protein
LSTAATFCHELSIENDLLFRVVVNVESKKFDSFEIDTKACRRIKDA